MPLTLREALASVDPLRQAQVLAGERGLDRIVQFVNVMEVPDILDWVRPGELLVTTMYPLRDQAAALETLIPKLAEKDLAGLAVTPLAYLDAFPQYMLDAANELDFPLIQLPPNTSFIDIIQPLTTRLLDLQATELIQSGDIHRQFIDLVLGGGGYAEIAQGISQMVRQPVSIVDRFRRILSNGFIIGQSRIQQRFILEDSTGDCYLSEDYAPELVGELPRTRARLMVTPSVDGPLEHVVIPVKVGSMVLGQIIVWSRLDVQQQHMELVALEHGATVAALKMMEKRSIDAVEQRFRNEILDGLLSEEPGPLARGIQLAREMGHHLTPPFAMILAAPDLTPGTVLPKTESIEQNNIDSSLHLAMRYVRGISPDAIYWYRGSRLVIFLPLPERGSRDKAWLVSELGKVCQRIDKENRPYTISMGISRTATELRQFRQAFEAANQSLQMGRIVQGKDRSVVAHYEDLGIFRIISLAQAPTGLERFCDESIGSLLAHDRENGADLVRTLRVYLEQNQNAAHTAEILHIHYNTLRYRIDKVREILGDSLDQPQQRLTIEVALQIHSVMNPS